jgi:hypothetical protein
MLGLLVQAALVGLVLGSRAHLHHVHLHQRQTNSSIHHGYTGLSVPPEGAGPSGQLNQTFLRTTSKMMLSDLKVSTPKKSKGVFAHFMVGIEPVVFTGYAALTTLRLKMPVIGSN